MFGSASPAASAYANHERITLASHVANLSGERYEWLEGQSPLEIDPAPLPPEWLEAMRKPPASVGAAGVPPESEEPEALRAVSQTRRLAGVRRHLEREPGEVRPDRATPDTAPHRVSNGLTFRMCCTLRRYAARDAEAVLDLLREIYNPKCEPPWDDHKLAETLAKAYDHGHNTWWGSAYVGEDGSARTPLDLDSLSAGMKARLGDGASAPPPPKSEDLRSYARARVNALARAAKPEELLARELLKRALSGEPAVDDDEVLGRAAVLIECLPAATTDDQVALLINAAGTHTDAAYAAIAQVRAHVAEVAADADPDPEGDPRKFDPASALEYMNSRYTWVLSLGVPADLHGADGRVELRKVNGWQLSLGNRTVRYEDESAPIASWWMAHPRRRECSRLGMWAPPLLAPPGAHNLWTGFAIAPAPGAWPLLRAHILDVIASGDAALAEYVFQWLAWVVQNPGARAEVALVLRGEEGTGKGTLGNALCDIFGHHAAHVTRPKDFVGGNFNAHMRDCAFFFADECYWAGDRSHEGTLKGMITEPTLRIEPKGIDSYETPNALSIMIASNNKWIVPAGVNARRFVICDVSQRYMGDLPYFERLRAEMSAGGLAAFLYDLLETDLEGWHPRAIVSTAALVEQKAATLPPEDRWVMELLASGELPAVSLLQKDAPPGWVEWSELRDSAAAAMDRRVGDEKLRDALRRAGGERKMFGKFNVRGWQFLSLEKSREKWCASHFAREWPKRDGWS